jgi:hypothetical protein
LFARICAARWELSLWPGHRRLARRDVMKMLYIVTMGTDDATQASVLLHIAANGSSEVG